MAVFANFLGISENNSIFGRFPNFGLSRNHTDLSQCAAIVVSWDIFFILMVARADLSHHAVVVGILKIVFVV